MRRLVAATLTLLAAVPSLALAQDVADVPPLRARLVTCQTGREAADRFAVFTGSMPALPGTQRMEMRFDLLQRHGGTAGFARVPLPKWGQWEHTERRGIAGFIFTKRVEQLAAPAVYRALVRFRWYAADGELLHTARRISPPCRQLDPRPDLTVGKVAGAPDGRYLVEVRNAGRTDAEPFRMSLAVDDVVGTIEVAALPAGEARTVAIGGNRCRPDELVWITLDTGDAIEEASERDNAVARPCPFA